MYPNLKLTFSQYKKLINITEYTRITWNLRLWGDLFKRVWSISLIYFFKVDIFKRVTYLRGCCFRARTVFLNLANRFWELKIEQYSRISF